MAVASKAESAGLGHADIRVVIGSQVNCRRRATSEMRCGYASVSVSMKLIVAVPWFAMECSIPAGRA